MCNAILAEEQYQMCGQYKTRDINMTTSSSVDSLLSAIKQQKQHPYVLHIIREKL